MPSLKRPAMPTTTRISRGIRIKKNGYEARVKHAGGRETYRRFPLTTPLEVIDRWRTDERARGHWDFLSRLPEREPLLPRSPDGWCYLYALRAGTKVKIGRSVDPEERRSKLQTSSSEPLELLVATPCHAALEAAVHERFAHLRINQEWFELTDELALFIGRLQDGLNPAPGPGHRLADRGSLRSQRRSRADEPAR